MIDTLTLLHKSVSSGQFDNTILDHLQAGRVKVNECEVLDFKRQLPDTDLEYMKVVRDLVALHNSFGGFLIFGIEETVKDRLFSVVGVPQNTLDINKIRNLTRSVIGHDLRILSDSILIGTVYVEIVWVAKRLQVDRPTRFIKNGPELKPKQLLFKKGDVVFRRLESNDVAKSAEDYDFLFSDRRPPSIEILITEHIKSSPLDNNLPDRMFVCSNFIGRRTNIGELWTWLADDFSRVRLIAGEGGLGKTSLAYHFSEAVASRGIKPFERVVWLTAKKRQFLGSLNTYRDNRFTDYHDANTLFRAIASAHGSIEADFEGLELRAIMEIALESCGAVPTFIVIDDVDSLTQQDQQRALEFGMRVPQGTKMLLTTRINFSYSPDNVIKLNGLEPEEFREYVSMMRERYKQPALPEKKFIQLRDVTGGSPLFTDSLLRLERRGVTLEKAITQWRGEQGIEVRQAALQREVEFLSREARRVLYVISLLKSCIYPELIRIVDYTDQTLGDALDELSSLFLINMPAVAKHSNYSVDPNTALLVIALAKKLNIDHTALEKRARSTEADAIGLTAQRRSEKVGMSIVQAMTLLKAGDARGALDIVQNTAKQLKGPHIDLLLASGRFYLQQTPPNGVEASKVFNQAYELGQRKLLLFTLWFEAEHNLGNIENALNVATKALECSVGDEGGWHEHRAMMHIALARRAGLGVAPDAALREINHAIEEFRSAEKKSKSTDQKQRINRLLDQAQKSRKQITG